ncbi:lipoprotein [Staphylococcus aureus]|uniref:Lipoprotein n=1 Tax=Staphylococcus aureus TaxID=1280 RepID=A0A2X2M8J9_STAAU|nr:lipoprotein [Staphylococcus aureus]
MTTTSYLMRVFPFDKSIIDSNSSLRSEDKGDDMSTLVGTVLSGFEYRAQKEKL